MMDMQITHRQACILSRIYNMHWACDPQHRVDDFYPINEMLKSIICAAYLAELGSKS